MKAQALCLFVVALIFLPTPSIADPSEEIRYLMNEPVSMMDFGMMRLSDFVKLRFETFADHGEDWKTVSSTRYDWTSNEIEIALLVIIGDRDDGEVTARFACGLLHGMIEQERLWPQEVILSCFRHSGYSTEKQTQFVAADRLGQMIKYYATVRYNDTSENQEYDLTATWEFDGSGFMMGREKVE